MVRILRRKFTLAAMLSMALVLTCILGVINLVNYRNMLQGAEKTLQYLAEHNGVFPGMEKDPFQEDGREPPALPDNMNPEMPFQTRYFSILTDRNGTILHTDFERIAAVDEGSAQQYVEEVLEKAEKDGFIGTYRYKVTEKTDTEMYVFLDCQKELDAFSDFLVSSILTGLAGLAAVAVLLWIFSGLAVKPFVENYEKQKRFITDAGHELKTPLTIIDADATVLEMETGESEWISDIHQQTARLKSLTEDLVYLAKTEEMGDGASEELFSLSDTASRAADSFRSAVLACGKKMETEIEPGLMMNGNAKSVERLFMILLDNALKYSSEGGTISVMLKGKGKNRVIEVQNPCESITKEQTEKLFDRFYRTDASRNSETGGHGIGLSIARAIVEKHKGKIAAFTPDGHSLRVQVIL